MMAETQRPGYILHADPVWVDYHLAHSIGHSFGYTRRVGAPMRNVEVGGYVFFLRRGDREKRLAFWGHFQEDIETTPAEAWARFGDTLGAPSLHEWLETFPILEDLNEQSPVRVLRFGALAVPIVPIPLESAGVAVVQRATKGWSIGDDDVDRLLRFGEAMVPMAIEADDYATEEGRRRLMKHLRIERNHEIVRRAKRQWQDADPAMRCRCCGESLFERYGERGSGFIEAHHTKPLGELLGNQPVRTRVEDLAPVCPNCHRMLHREPTITVAGLRQQMLNE